MKATDVLAGDYTMVITNVPYLSSGTVGTAFVRKHAQAKATLHRSSWTGHLGSSFPAARRACYSTELVIPPPTES